MSKQEQMLVMTPSDKITFRPPFTSVSTSQLSLRNPTKEALAFKIKTTAPKRYCVRPNAGFVAPDQEAEIKVMLQPGSIEEKHKFLVQSIIAPENYNELSKEEQTALWSNTAKAMSSKLMCEFVTKSTVEAGESADTVKPDAPKASIKSEPPQYNEVVHQHQQNIPEPKREAKKVEVEKPASTSSNQESQAEEIKRLRAELAEALKKIEELSSLPISSRADKADEQKNLLIYLFIAFMLGFLVAALI